MQDYALRAADLKGRVSHQIEQLKSETDAQYPMQVRPLDVHEVPAVCRTCAGCALAMPCLRRRA